jgi:hypothetical protein
MIALSNRASPLAGMVVVVAAAGLSACRSGGATERDGGGADRTDTTIGLDIVEDWRPEDSGPPPDGPERAPQPTLEPTLTGGARLLPRVWITSDGDALPSVTARFDVWDEQGFIGQWFDTQLGVDCMFGVAEDGVRRCLPVDRDPVQEGYLDDACTVVGYGYTLALARYRTSPTGSAGCVDQKYRVRRIVAPIATPTMIYGPNGTGAPCTGRVNAGADAHWGTAEILPPSMFVGSKSMVIAGAGGLSIVATVADDGAVERVGLLNTARNETCGATYLGTEFRCLPDVMQSYAQPFYFTDSACKIATPAVSLCASKPYVWSNQPLPSVADSCGVAPTGLVFKAFAPVSGLFLLKSGACTADAADPVAIVAQAGADIPLANFPVVETIQRGRARLKTPYLAPPGGAALVRSGSLHFDSVLKTDCEMITIGGRTLCRPASTIGIEYFADPECKNPVYSPPSPVDCRKPPPGTVRLRSTGQAYKVTDRPYNGATYVINGTPLACHVSGVSQTVTELDPVPAEELVTVRAGIQ